MPSDIGDPLLNTWILAWVSHALLSDPLNLFNANIFYPLPTTLAYSEHLFSTTLLALPVQVSLGEPVLAYNLTLLTSFPLTAFGMYLLALRWTGRRSAAFIAGLVLAFSPYRLAAIAHVQLLTIQWLPLAVLFIDLVLERPGSGPALPSPRQEGRLKWGRGVREQRGGRGRGRLLGCLGLLVWLQVMASWYLAVYTLLIVGIYLAGRLAAARPGRGAVVRLGLPLLLAGLLALPFVRPYLGLVAELRAARPLALAQSLAAAPADYLAAAPFNRLAGPLSEPLRARPAFSEENTLFPGLLAPLLALWAMSNYQLVINKKRPISGDKGSLTVHNSQPSAIHNLQLILLVILVLSLAMTFPGPYGWLAGLFPPSTIVRVPARWIIPALFALAGLAALGYARINEQLAIQNSKFKIQNSKFILFPACLVILLAESLSVPLPLAEVGSLAALNPAYEWLAGQPGPAALVELPLHSAPAPEYSEVKRLYASTRGWWRLVNGYSGYTPPRQPELAQALAGFPDEPALAALQALAAPAAGLPAGRPLYLLVHPGEAPLERTRWENETRWQAERRPALRPVGQFAGDYLYQVLPAHPARFAGPPLATFGRPAAIHLWAATIAPDPSVDSASQPSAIHNSRFGSVTIFLYWSAAVPPSTDYTVFIHLRAADGFVLGQADGPPVGGHYPSRAWLPGEIVQDVHPLPAVEAGRVDHLAIGLYDPASGERLLALGPDGQRLANDAVVVGAGEFSMK